MPIEPARRSYWGWLHWCSFCLCFVVCLCILIFNICMLYYESILTAFLIDFSICINWLKHRKYKNLPELFLTAKFEISVTKKNYAHVDAPHCRGNHHACIPQPLFSLKQLLTTLIRALLCSLKLFLPAKTFPPTPWISSICQGKNCCWKWQDVEQPWPRFWCFGVVYFSI